MVHPDVLRRVGYDPSRYQGFAFGGGIERLQCSGRSTRHSTLLQNDLRYWSNFDERKSRAAAPRAPARWAPAGAGGSAAA